MANWRFKFDNSKIKHSNRYAKFKINIYKWWATSQQLSFEYDMK